MPVPLLRRGGLFSHTPAMPHSQAGHRALLMWLAVTTKPWRSIKRVLQVGQ